MGLIQRRFDQLQWPQAQEAAQRPGATLVWPFGALEQHGPHLPLATDALFADRLLDDVLSKLDPGLPIWRLPTQAVGFSPEHLDFPGTLSLPPQILINTIESLGSQIADQGFRRLVLFNAHGGQIALLQVAARQLRSLRPQLAVLPCFLWSGVAGLEAWIPGEELATGLHAGLAETSLMLHLKPEAVGPERPQDGIHRGHHPATPPQGWSLENAAPTAWLTSDLSSSGVIGDSRNASAACGEALHSRLVDHWVELFSNLMASAWPPTHALRN
jgi:creatinine amidohydrolase